jgi:hypothetical protein
VRPDGLLQPLLDGQVHVQVDGSRHGGGQLE